VQTTRPTRPPRWYFIPARVLFVTFIFTLLAFAVGLFLSILGVVILARVQGVNPDLRIAYRHIALPAALVAGSVVLVAATVLEILHYRQSKALAGIAQASR
jgi:hypothetical protein